jgi:L-asparaginase/Glu-tRNA(Gln) amidotransferase subunit D
MRDRHRVAIVFTGGTIAMLPGAVRDAVAVAADPTARDRGATWQTAGAILGGTLSGRPRPSRRRLIAG